MLTQRGLDVVQLVRNRSGQIGFQNFLDFWKYFAPIALRVPFLHPEGDRDRLFILGLREETSSATDKLASFILESAVFGRDTPEGIRFNLRLKQEEIAQVVGVTRETVARALRELRDKKLITINGASVLIMNKPALEAMITAEITNEKGITTQNRGGARSGITAD